MIYGIFACDQKAGIGKDNNLPWPMLRRDLVHFAHITKGATLLMGRKTWDSLPEKPLPGRKNIVITSDVDNYDHAMDMEAAIDFLEETDDDVYIIGGASIYKALEHLVDYWYITVIAGDYKCDTYFHLGVKGSFEKVGEIPVNDGGVHITFKEYRRKTC